jgi:hypothetical protein
MSAAQMALGGRPKLTSSFFTATPALISGLTRATPL